MFRLSINEINYTNNTVALNKLTIISIRRRTTESIQCTCSVGFFEVSDVRDEERSTFSDDVVDCQHSRDNTS